VDAGFDHLAAVRPRLTRARSSASMPYERGCRYQVRRNISASLAGLPNIVPVISDFCSTTWSGAAELEILNSAHDMFLVLIDSAFAFEVPSISAGWIQAFDVETGRSRTLSRRALRNWPGEHGHGRIRSNAWPTCGSRRPSPWHRRALQCGGPDRFAERRLRKS
jgi:hypothetical protein